MTVLQGLLYFPQAAQLQLGRSLARGAGSHGTGLGIGGVFFERATPRRSPPGIANTWACPSSRSRPTGLSRPPGPESRRFGPRSLRTPPTSVRARHRSWSTIASGTSTPCWPNSELPGRRWMTESRTTTMAGSAGRPTRRATDSSYGSRAHPDRGKRTRRTNG